MPSWIDVSHALKGLGIDPEDARKIGWAYEGARPEAITGIAQAYHDIERRNRQQALQEEYAPWNMVYNPEAERQIKREQMMSNERLKEAYNQMTQERAMQELANRRYIEELRQSALTGRQQTGIGYKREALGKNIGFKEQQLGVREKLGMAALDQKKLQMMTDADLRREQMQTQHAIALLNNETQRRRQDLTYETSKEANQVRREWNALTERLGLLRDETNRRRMQVQFDIAEIRNMTSAQLKREQMATDKEIARLDREARTAVGDQRNFLYAQRTALENKRDILQMQVQIRGQETQKEIAAGREKGITERAAADRTSREKIAALNAIKKKIPEFERQRAIRAIMDRVTFIDKDTKEKRHPTFAEAQSFYEKQLASDARKEFMKTFGLLQEGQEQGPIEQSPVNPLLPTMGTGRGPRRGTPEQTSGAPEQPESWWWNNNRTGGGWIY